MTKKDYIRIAKVLNCARQDADDYGAGGYWVERAATLMADELAKDNPRFDRKRFLAACGFGE